MKIRGDDIICVDIPSIALNNRHRESPRRYVPFTALEVTNSVWKDETVACADYFDNTTGYVILSAAGVRLIHCVELATTTLDLESIRLDKLI